MNFQHELDLQTYAGWTLSAVQLLQDKPTWTAIVDEPGQGYLVLLDGVLCSLPKSTQAGHVYSEDEAVRVDATDWENKAWIDMQASSCEAVLATPRLELLRHQTEDEPMSATTAPASSVLSYTLPTDNSTDEWARCETKDFVPTARQSLVVEAVRQALSKGLFYSEAVRLFVAEKLDVSDEILAANYKARVEGGVFAMDCYYARRYVEAQERIQRDALVKALLKPHVGQKLGTLVFNDFKRCTGVTVVEAGELIVLTCKRGPKPFSIEVEYESIRHAMDRAFVRGQRKENFNSFVGSAESH